VAVTVDASQTAGVINNSGTLSGSAFGIDINPPGTTAGTTVSGGIVNSGTLVGTTVAGIGLHKATILNSISNNGTISSGNASGGTEMVARYDVEYRENFLNLTASVKARWLF
jgi:hypothetical protein